jgi:hypothetical protein
MNWQEHEKEYCVVINFRPADEDIFDIVDSWAGARHQIDGYELENGEYPGSRLKCVKFLDDSYIVHCNSLEQEKLYLRLEYDG